MKNYFKYLDVSLGRFELANSPMNKSLREKGNGNYYKIRRNDSKASRRFEFGCWILFIHKKYYYWYIDDTYKIKGVIKIKKFNESRVYWW